MPQPQKQQDLKQKYRKKNTFWRRWGALFILILLFVGSWGGQFVNQLQTSKQEAIQHHQKFEMSDFWPEFWESTFENWQSEWLQLFMQGLLIAGFADYLFRKGQSDEYKTHLMIEDLQKEVASLKQHLQKR